MVRQFSYGGGSGFLTNQESSANY